MGDGRPQRTAPENPQKNRCNFSRYLGGGVPMRNLKRALSLGLTATMISGLMVMGSSAASYADVTSKQNEGSH